MSIPLDRLYNHLDGLCNHDAIIYRFSPHGSKKLLDLNILRPQPWFEHMTKPLAFMHDQEPLNHHFYRPEVVEETISLWKYADDLHNLAKGLHLRGASHRILNACDYSLIIHSEKNSTEVPKFEQNGFIGVYWWAHAAIARDWFRYAEHDLDLSYNIDDFNYDFLAYNRAWSGTREYRLKFSELLLEKNLIACCNTRFAATDNDLHYTQHKFVNPELQIQNHSIEQSIPANTTTACYSADYNNHDYKTAGIDVVLETLFDETRHHLTEKVLRPIACGKPFILAATLGSLQYLRDYGFKTFAPYINEHYDTVTDPLQRLQAITDEMVRINRLPLEEKARLFEKLHSIAKYNKDLFFSDAWHQQIFKEFETNFQTALKLAMQHRTGKYWKMLGMNIERIGPQYASGPEEVQKFLDWFKQVNA